jgi:hypothetical protein
MGRSCVAPARLVVFEIEDAVYKLTVGSADRLFWTSSSECT